MSKDAGLTGTLYNCEDPDCLNSCQFIYISPDPVATSPKMCPWVRCDGGKDVTWKQV